MYKITIVPFIKMLNSHSAFMASSWPQKNNAINFSKKHNFGQVKVLPDLEIWFDINIRVNCT